MAELVAGGGVGAVFGELLKIVLETTTRCVNFKETLARLLDTLVSLDPVIQKMEQQNSQLRLPEEELQSLLSIMRDGKQLIHKCSQTYQFNPLARSHYEKKLQKLIKSLERFITIDLQVQATRDIKEILLNVLIILKKLEKRPCLKEQLKLLLSWIRNSFTNLSAESSTNGIHANEDTHKKKEFIFRGFLSVTVISAENLPASDFNGKSDPFVVLTLSKAKSKAETIYKTKVVNDCLNPNWNQKFVFDVEDGLQDEVMVEVWDKDTFGKDDFLGKCTLSLHRVILEKVYEGRFKLIGAESSYLKLHLKWNDSNFLPSLSNDLVLKPVGILKVKLLQAKELTNKHIIRKSDPFAVLYVQASGDKEKKSKTINNDLNPIWNENFEFIIEDVSTEHLKVEVYDSKHLWSSKLISCAQIRLSELQPGKVKYVWSPLEIQRDNKNRGQVHVELLYCPFGMENSITNPFPHNHSIASLEEVLEGSAYGIEANGNENSVTQKEKEVIIRGFLSVTVISAKDLPALDFMRKSDPFVALTLRKAKSKEETINQTRVVNQDLNPDWDQTFDFVVEDGLHDMVIVEVWDKDTFRKDYMGRCILSLTKVILEGEYTESFELVGAKSGSLKLHLKWRP